MEIIGVAFVVAILVYILYQNAFNKDD